jgi:cytochrome P450
MWVVSRFDDVRQIQSDPDRFSSRPNADEGSATPTDVDNNPEMLERLLAIVSGMPVDFAELTAARPIVAADPPDHTRMRRIVNRGFTPRRTGEMADKINQIVERCLDGIDDTDSYEVVQNLAIPLPVQMIADLLGIESDHYADVKRWSDHYSAAAVGDVRGTAEGQLLAVNMFKEFSAYLVPLIDARRKQPKGDVISAMVRAVDDESLTTVETLMMSMTIMVAGNETSTNLIGNTLVELIQNPDQLALLRADPNLLPNAVEEANRISTPIQFMFREALVDAEVAGTTIPKGATVVLHVAAANRDPAAFEEPDRFLITRPGGKSLAFGHGIHFCLGAHLAGLEVRTAIAKLLPHLDRFQLSEDPLVRNPSALLNGWQRIELVA